MTEDELDDVALFIVRREEDGETWQVPVFLSPLFRVMHLPPLASVESRQEMVAGLGAQAIVERLNQGETLPFAESLVFAIDYPGAPDKPNPLIPYDQVVVRVNDQEKAAETEQ
ncbi:MAG TPA: hypothetical protein ENN19_03855 [Chloroflexi bacterium]|nr:hypothetical protein [Chloroflexota bacterium]